MQMGNEHCLAFAYIRQGLGEIKFALLLKLVLELSDGLLHLHNISLVDVLCFLYQL